MIYKQPKQRTNTITYQGTFYSWKEINQKIKTLNYDLYLRIEKELLKYHRHQFLPITFNLEEAEIIRST